LWEQEIRNMKQSELCRPKWSYKTNIYTEIPEDLPPDNFTGTQSFGRVEGIKRIRMKCPKCGRRVMSSVMYHDNEAIHSVPAHKPKGWWKKKKRGKNEKRYKRTRGIY